MLEAKDLFFIIATLAVLWTAGFFCFFLYQLIRLIKRAHDVLGEVRYRVEKVEQTLQGMRGKFDDGTAHLGKIVEQIKKSFK